MTSWAARPILLLLVTAACNEPPLRPQTQTPPEATPLPVAEPAPKNDAIARADALLEDLKRREAAQAKFDRENRAPAATPIPARAPGSRLTPSATALAVAPPAATDVPAAQPAPASPAADAPARDETWWRQQRQSLQRTLDEALARLAEAEKERYRFAYNDLQAEYKQRVAAVAEARGALDRLHDEARRAGVPPAWLR